MRNNPFKRSALIFEFLASVRDAITGSVPPEIIASMDPYKSRGHGIGRNSGNTIRKIHRTRANYKPPHQGQRECARRLRGHNPAPIARRMWTMPKIFGYTMASSRQQAIVNTGMPKKLIKCLPILSEVRT